MRRYFGGGPGMEHTGKTGRFAVYAAAVLLVVGLLLAAYVKWENQNLVTEHFTVRSEKLPAAFAGFRIAQISDLHNTAFGPAQEKLLGQLRAAKPDMVVITGDLIDSRRAGTENAEALLAGVQRMELPIYYVSGNHEAWSRQWPQLQMLLAKYGAKNVSGETVSIEKDGARLLLAGMEDPAFWRLSKTLQKSVAAEKVQKLLTTNGENIYKILLTHRPELLSAYAATGADLVFAGHAHGGQVRLPFIGALATPDQGLLPKYTDGLYTEKTTVMAVSRGLGNSVLPVRFLCSPELLVVTLEQKN